VVARVGGDEFAVALEEVGGPQVASIADRIRSSIAALDAGPDGAAPVRRRRPS
jgi:GGDEF domain-containing protein